MSDLLEPLVSTIETIKDRIDRHGASLRQNETRTRAALIDPLLQALGWDTTDPALITPEYRTGGWADYALIGPGSRPVAIIEAKRLGSVVENHLEQAVGYCIQEGIAYAGVTDGSHWQLYRTFEPVPLVEKLVLDVSIANTPPHEAALKMLLLWRPNMASGHPVAASEPVLDPLLKQSVMSEPVSEPTATTQLQISGSESNWIPLANISPSEVKKYGNPTAVRFSEGDVRETRNWRWVLREITEWTIRIDKLTAAQCPIQKMPFINAEPISYTGKPFRNYVQLPGGLYFTADWRLDVLVRLSQRLLTHFNIPVDGVELRFE